MHKGPAESMGTDRGSPGVQQHIKNRGTGLAVHQQVVDVHVHEAPPMLVTRGVLHDPKQSMKSLGSGAPLTFSLHVEGLPKTPRMLTF